MNRIVFLPLLLLACASTVPFQLSPVPAPVPTRELPQMVVEAETLYIRTQPDGDVSAYLLVGDHVTVYRVEVVGDTLWCRITPPTSDSRYVACRYLGE